MIMPVITGLKAGIGTNDNASDNGVKGWYLTSLGLGTSIRVDGNVSENGLNEA